MSTDKSDKKALKLSADELAAVDKGVESLENGRKWSIEEAFEFARKRREEWKKAVKKDLSA